MPAMRAMTDKRLNKAVARCSEMTQREACDLLQNSFPLWIGYEKSQENKAKNKVAAEKRHKI